MIFRQVINDDLGCASYLVGDEEAGVAAVVDPKLELAQPDYDHEPFDDGWELALGRVVVRALHTPGHRPEHTAFALVDTARGPEPWAVLSGDALFVGDIARPDLAVEKEEGARDIFRSLREGLLCLPGACEVWPGHLGGSLCGGPGMDMKVSSTIDYERARRPLLAVTDVEEFVHRTTSTLGPQPPNFKAIVARNRGSRVTEPVDADALTPRQVELKRSEGALVVDVRTDLQFDDAHVPGAVCNPTVRAGFGTKLAWVADREQEVVLVGRDDEDAVHAAHLAASVGITEIAGHLAGEMTSWHEERRPTESVERLAVDDLQERLAADPGLQLLDVRERAEWDEGHIPGSVHCPYHDVNGLPEGIDAQRPVAVICSSGQRAAVAASLLRRFGAERVDHVTDGGVATWSELGGQTERREPAHATG